MQVSSPCIISITHRTVIDEKWSESSSPSIPVFSAVFPRTRLVDSILFDVLLVCLYFRRVMDISCWIRGLIYVFFQSYLPLIIVFHVLIFFYIFSLSSLEVVFYQFHFLFFICFNGVHYYVLLEWAPALMGVSPSGCLHVFFCANKLSLNNTVTQK